MTNELPWFLQIDNPEEVYTQNNYLVFDLETDTEDKGSALNEANDIVCACWQVVSPDGTVLKKASHFGGIYEQQELLDDIASVTFVVAQNAKFDIQWMRRCGLELRDVLVYDTMLAQWAMDGNKKLDRSLGGMCKRYGIPGKIDYVAKLIELGVKTRDIHPFWLVEYCHQDVEATKQLFIKQQRSLTVRKQWHLAFTRNLCCTALADLEFEGLNLDPERVYEEYVKAMQIKEEVGAELAVLTGGINLGSPKQLGEFLYGKMGFKVPKDHKGDELRNPPSKKQKAEGIKVGAPKTDTKTLVLLKPVTDDQLRFLKIYKSYNKQVSLLEKNLEYFKLTCEQRGGKFYGLFKQNAVQTGRLASSGIPITFKGKKKAMSVQMQNIPREFKRLFWSGEEGWDVAEFDSAQLEFRVAVDMGHDRVGLAEIEGGVDIHSFTSNVLTQAGEPTDRQNSKQYTFKPLYGGGRGTPAVEAYCEFFKAKYEGISSTQRGWALKCCDQKQFTTPYGMTFYFPDTKMQKSGYITNTTSIYNFPVQGFATGEIIPVALVYFWHRTRGMAVKIMSTIHDSIAVKIRQDAVDEVTEVAKLAMASDVYNYLLRVYRYKFVVPLGLGRKVSRHWSDTKDEAKWNVWPTGVIKEVT